MKVGNNATHSTPHAACLIPDTSRTPLSTPPLSLSFSFTHSTASVATLSLPVELSARARPLWP